MTGMFYMYFSLFITCFKTGLEIAACILIILCAVKYLRKK